MTASSNLRVHRRGASGPGERLGEARLLWPGVAQALPPLDAVLGRTPHRADELMVVPLEDSGTAGGQTTAAAAPIRVLRLRPALVSYADAERLAGEHGAAGMFSATTAWMVALELGDPDADPESGRGNLDPGGARPDVWPHPPHDPDCAWPFPHPGWCRVLQPWWCRIFCVSSSCDTC